MKKFFYFVLISATGLFLLLLNIDSHNLWGDEAYTLWQAGKSLSNLLMTIFQQDPHPPIYYIVMKLWVSFLGISITSGLYFSILFSVLSILAGVYLCGIIFGNYKSLYIMLFLIITSPFYIMFSRMIRYYSFVSFLVLVCLIFFIKYLNSEKKIWWFFLLFAHVVLIYSDYPASTIFLGELCSVLFIKRYRNKIFGIIIIFFITVLAFIPWVTNLFYCLNHLIMLPHKALFSYGFLGLIMRFLFSVYDFFVGECVYPWKFYITVPLFFVFLYAIKNLVNKRLSIKNNSSFMVLLTTISVAFISVIFMVNYFVGKQSFIYTPSRLMFCFIPVMIILSRGLYFFGKKRYYFLAAILACNSVSLYSYYNQEGFINPVYTINWNKAFDDLKENLEGGEIVISGESEVLQYYVKERLPGCLFFYNEQELKKYLSKNVNQADTLKFIIFQTRRDSTDSGMFSSSFIEKLINESQIVECKEYTPLSGTYIKIKKYFGGKGYTHKMRVITVLTGK